MRKSLKAMCAMSMGFSLIAPSPAIAQTNYAVVFDAGYELGYPGFLMPNRSDSNDAISKSYSVSSKYNQPRNEGTNPHRGTDLLSPFGRPVHAVWNGWVVYANAAQHEVDIRLDVNQNYLEDDNVYVRYDHLSEVNVIEGQPVSQIQRIGKSGNEGGSVAAHLHFGMMVRFSTSSSRPNLWMPNSPFYTQETDWRGGSMLDFISFPNWRSNYASVFAYGFDQNMPYYKPIAARDVWFFHRISGSGSPWNRQQAKKGANDSFYFNFGDKYPNNTLVEWMVQANRTDLKNTGFPYYWAYYPAKFAQPASDPNSTPNTFNGLVSTVVIPPNPPPANSPPPDDCFRRDNHISWNGSAWNCS